MSLIGVKHTWAEQQDDCLNAEAFSVIEALTDLLIKYVIPYFCFFTGFSIIVVPSCHFVSLHSLRGRPMSFSSTQEQNYGVLFP